MGIPGIQYYFGNISSIYVTIINRVQRGPESIAFDSEAMRARRIIVLVKSNWLVKSIENKNFLAA